MGLSIEAKGRLIQLVTGVHLVTVPEKGVVYVTDKNNVPVVTESGEVGVRFRLMDNDGKIFEQDYWLKGNREWIFNDFCKAAKIDPNTEKIRNESKGKRCWICVKEIWKVNGEETVMDPLTGQPDLTYQIFKFIPFDDSGKKPVVPGDPELNKGQALEPFVDYIDVSGEKAAAPVVEEKKAENEDDWDSF